MEAILGCTFTAVRAVDEYAAHHAPLPDGPRRYELLQALTARLDEHCLRFRASGYTVFLGLLDDRDPPGLFAIAGADPIRLMAIFAVGSHNDVIGDTPDRAARFMASLSATDPFVPYLVDPANFRVRFLGPVSLERAREIAGAVLEFDPDAYCEVAQIEDADQDFDPVEQLARNIQARQKLDLWWD